MYLTIGSLTRISPIAQSTGNALTATGSASTDALVLKDAINNVTTTAASTGVILPKMEEGKTFIVFNNGSNELTVYAQGTTTIDGTAGSTGVALTAASRCAYTAVADGVVLSHLLGAISS